MRGILSDLKLVIRQLRNSPGFTATAVLMLAFGIGATTAIFSIVDGVLLRPLPFPQANRLVTLGDQVSNTDWGKQDPGPVTGPRYDDPPLARQAAAITGAYGAPVPAPAAEAPAAPAPPAPAAAPAPAPGADPAGGRYVGRRSARKTRVTTQAIFSQLLDLAAIPQSSYAVDDEVDGAMCLVRARGGYEVFSSADRARHEVRFFEDEEAAYFYLFGVLAAEAIRNGQLGPQS